MYLQVSAKATPCTQVCRSGDGMAKGNANANAKAKAKASAKIEGA